ncbi:MAG: hypothetical protein E6Q50_02685 [Lysobacter sp.]|nr:MAG: hypothetical protein E6Q50_02685 [Lysobacter sp.]
MSASIPALKWLRIAAYGSFHDIPRSIVALDRDFVLWLFDCPFEDALDDYGEEYGVYRIGTNTMDAKRALQARSAMDALPAEAYVGKVPVENVEFDATRRHMMFVHTRRFVPPPAR